MQAAYKKVAAAMEEVRATGYGIVIPDAGELELEEPEIIKQGGRYGVRLRAKAPSIHMIRADIQAEVSPIVGSEKQSEDMLGFLLQEFEGSRSGSGSPTSSAGPSMSSSTRTWPPSSSTCPRTPGRRCVRPWRRSSTRGRAG